MSGKTCHSSLNRNMIKSVYSQKNMKFIGKNTTIKIPNLNLANDIIQNIQIAL